MSKYFENGQFLKELKNACNILEELFHDMVEFEFIVENEKLFLLSARPGKRSTIASIKIALSLLCEGKINVNECINRLNPKQIACLISGKKLINENELILISEGIPTDYAITIESSGIAVFSKDSAKKHISKQQPFIYCINELWSYYDVTDEIDIVRSQYCAGICTTRRGLTSHAPMFCRKAGIACIIGICCELTDIENTLKKHNTNILTLYPEKGFLFAGEGRFESSISAIKEIPLLYEILASGIKYNFWNKNVISKVWDLWDAIVYKKLFYEYNNSEKKIVEHKSDSYVSFVQPSVNEQKKIILSSNTYWQR